MNFIKLTDTRKHPIIVRTDRILFVERITEVNDENPRCFTLITTDVPKDRLRDPDQIFRLYVIERVDDVYRLIKESESK